MHCYDPDDPEYRIAILDCWRRYSTEVCFAALADAYGNAHQSGEAFNMAVQKHEGQLQKRMRKTIERYENNGAKTEP